jgi:hypothetical protein
MILPTLNRTALRWALAPNVQLDRVYEFETGQSGQTGHRVEYVRELRAVSRQKAGSYNPNLASRTAHRPIPGECDASKPAGASHPHPQRAPAP